MVNIGVFNIVPKVNEEDIITLRTRGGVSTLEQTVNKAGTTTIETILDQCCFNVGTRHDRGLQVGTNVVPNVEIIWRVGEGAE